MNNYFKKILLSSIIFTFLLPVHLFAQEAKVNKDSDGSKWLEDNKGSSPSYNEDDYLDDLRPGNYNPSQDRKIQDQKGTALEGTAKCTLSNVAASIGAKLFGGAVDTVAASVTNPNLVPVIDVLNARKEVGLGGGYGPSMDSIGVCIINSLIQYISDSTIDWINNGFEGNPTFIDNPGRIVKDIQEDTLTAFIDGIGNGILCERFSADIVFALRANLQNKRKVVPDRCTLDEAKANFDRFLSGEDFSFEMMNSVTSNPGNNVLGAYITSQSKLGNAIEQRTDTVFKEAAWGGGYLSWKDDKGNTVTPSKLIADTLVPEKLNMATSRLVIADEFDEIMTALFDALINKAVNEVLGT